MARSIANCVEGNSTEKLKHTPKKRKMLQRQVAQKIQAGDILIGKPIFEGDRFTALDHAGTRVSRVNILGNIIDKYVNEEKKYCTLTLDDGSGQLRLKGFSDQFEILNSPQIGDTVRAIGLLRFFNNELYILPEIIKPVDPRWLHIRRLELGIKKENIEKTTPGGPVTANQNNANITPEKQEPKKEAVEKVQEVQITQEKIGGEKPAALPATQPTQTEQKVESPKLKALEIIKTKKEVEINELIPLLNTTKEEMNKIINDLITEGEIYELKPGYLCSVN